MWGKGLGRAVRGMVDVRRDELPRVLPFVGAYAILLASLYILKPARNALFIHQAGVAQLPNVLMIVALVGGTAASLFARASKRLALEPLVLSTFGVLVAMLVGFRVLLTTEWVWVYYAFYVWVSLFGLVSTSLVWLLANAAFDHREARRVFGIIGTGGIAGAILGGAFTGRVVAHVGTNDLLIICAFFVACAMALLKMVAIPEPAQKDRRAAREASEDRGTLALVARSPLLLRLALLSWVIAIVSVVVEIQFNEIVDRSFETTDSKTAFFGEMLAWLSAFAFLFQLFLTPRILRGLGVGPALLFLPASLALGSAFMLVAPGLLAAIALKVGDGGFRHSVHKSATEVVFLPVPGPVKRQVKLFLDTTVDTTGTGIGALVALGVAAVGFEYRALGWLSIVLVGVAVLLALGLKGAYVDAFRSALDKRELELGDLRLELNDASTVRVMLPALKSTNERQLVYALDVLSSAKTPQLHAVVRPLLSHASAEVRRRAASALSGASEPALVTELERLLEDPDHEVRAAAVGALALAAADGRIERLRGLLASPSPHIRRATVAAICDRADLGARHLVDDALVTSFLADDGPDAEESRAVIAEALGAATEPTLRQKLKLLAQDPSPRVVDAVITAVGRSQDRHFVPWLVTKLADKRHRVAARRALAAFGPELVGTLRQVMLEDEVDLALRRGIPRVLCEIPAQPAVDALVAALDAKDPLLRDLAITALVRARTRFPGARLTREAVDPPLFRAARSAYALYEVTRALEPSSQASGILVPRKIAIDDASTEREAHTLLLRAVREKRAQAILHVFRLLGLRYLAKDMESAYQALTSGDRAARASAVEFLDNLLSERMKKVVIPLVDDGTPDELVARGRELFGHHIETPEDALGWLFRCDDAWLRACAIYEAGASARVELEAAILAAKGDPSPIVRETVELVRAELGAHPRFVTGRGCTIDAVGHISPGRRSAAVMLSVIEKVIFLQKVDVFSEVSTEQLAFLAAIAEELGSEAATTLYREQDVSDSMYLVLEGRVRLHRGETEVTTAGPGEAFGTWALFDDEPRVVAATTLEASRLLRIDKEDFIDLLADNIKITQGVLKAVVRRLRGLVVGRPGARPTGS